MAKRADRSVLVGGIPLSEHNGTAEEIAGLALDCWCSGSDLGCHFFCLAPWVERKKKNSVCSRIKVVLKAEDFLPS